MNNIIGNAAKYMGEQTQGSIKLRLLEEKEYIRVEVEDNSTQSLK